MFKLKPRKQMKKLLPITEATIGHQNNGVKEKHEPVSFINVGAIFEHQVEDMYASRKVQVISFVCMPETYFRQAKGHLRLSVLTSSINIIKNTFVTVYEVESQTIDNRKL